MNLSEIISDVSHQLFKGIVIAQEPATEVFTPYLTKGLTIQKHCLQYRDPKKLAHFAGFQCPVPNLNTPKGPPCYPKSIMLQFQICYQSHLNVSQNTKTNINFRGQAWVRHPAKCWVKGFMLPHKHHAPNFYRRFWHTLAD